MIVKTVIFDIDGTLLPAGAARFSQRTVQALRMLQKQGTLVVIATGRALFAAKAVLGGFRPDILASANGNWIVDKSGAPVHENRMTDEEMYALVDYCEDYELPLDFIFEDGYHAYVEYEAFVRYAEPHKNNHHFLVDGEDQVRHLQSMPYGASALLSEKDVAGFQKKYGYLGLRFVPFHGIHHDILRPGTNKAQALEQVLAARGIGWKDVAAFGDGLNDAELLRAAGTAVVMENGVEELRRQADLIAPDAALDGAADVLERCFLERGQEHVV